MSFPLQDCPVCGEPAMNVTALDDAYYRYVCTNVLCKSDKPFAGAARSQKTIDQARQACDRLVGQGLKIIDRLRKER
jgi:hypothetical protein